MKQSSLNIFELYPRTVIAAGVLVVATMYAWTFVAPQATILISRLGF
jgi:hypothetical protein